VSLNLANHISLLTCPVCFFFYRAEKFDLKYKNHANLLCQMVIVTVVDVVNLLLHSLRVELSLCFISFSFVSIVVCSCFVCMCDYIMW